MRYIIAATFFSTLVPVIARAESAQEILDRTRATYAALQSYSDTGVVINEYGASSQDQHTFKTSFSRNPRRFLLDVRTRPRGKYNWLKPLPATPRVPKVTTRVHP